MSGKTLSPQDSLSSTPRTGERRRLAAWSNSQRPPRDWRRPLQAAAILLAGFSSALGQNSSSNATRNILTSLPTKGYEFAWWNPFSAAPSTLHWRFGVDLSDFPGTVQDALTDAAPVPVANYVGNGVQTLSADIPRPMGPDLFAGELRAARDLDVAIVAYRVAKMPSLEADARRLFEFAKRLHIEVLMLEEPLAAVTHIEALAQEYDLHIALCGPYRIVVEQVRRSGPSIGACLNNRRLARENIAPNTVVSDLKDRIMIVELQNQSGDGDHSPFDDRVFLQDLYEAGVKPALFVLRPADGNSANPAPQLRQAAQDLNGPLLPLLADLAGRISRASNQTRGEETPEQRAVRESYVAQFATGNFTATPAGRAAVEAALPDHPIVKPRKLRKLLVLDLNVAYPGHQSSPTHDYGLKQLGLRTGAYEAVFDNNLDNLKYPKIKDYDAVFLNSTVGLVFSDPQVREGLLRFVREGGGLGADHGSVYASMDWPEFAQLLGAFPAGGFDQLTAWLKVDDPRSPLNAAFAGQEMLYQDEYYFFTDPYSREQMHVLLSIDVEKTDMAQSPALQNFNVDNGREDSDYAVSWIREYGRGRVFYTVLGHNPTLFSTPQLARHMLGGIQYILGDLPADATPSAQIAKEDGK